MAPIAEAQSVFVRGKDGTQIACRYRAGIHTGPVIVFLPGYMSDMLGSKAQALDSWAAEKGHAMLRLDYSGCGESKGDFTTGCLSTWRDEVLLAIGHFAPDAPIILIGSSMGGWLMLLVGLALEAQQPGRLAGMVGIAAAPDFTDWGYTDAQKAALAAGETVYEDNPYGLEPTPTYARFWADGERQRVLHTPIALTCPVRLIHGQQDADVPWEIAMRLACALHSSDVQTILIKDGDHRLSGESEIALLLNVIADVLPGKGI